MKFLSCKSLLKFSTTSFLALITAISAARGDGTVNGQWFGDHVVQNGRIAIKGNIWTLQHVYYVGDELHIQMEFPRGSELLASGAVDAFIVVFARAGAVYSIPVPSDVGATPRKLWRIPYIDIDELPEGQYQVALVVTKPGGDARKLEDWYGGFRALLDSEAIYMAATPIDSDADIDGEHDDDTDGDGINGEEADEMDDESMP